MRKTIHAVIATSLTLALVAATAQAQTLRTGPATASGSTNSLARPTPGSSNTTTGSAGTSATNNGATNNGAAASSPTSGSNSTSLGGASSSTSTSASGSTSGTTGTTATGSTSGTTAGTSQSGTSSGDAFSGSSRGNVPAMGAASQNNSSNSMGTNFNANGERLGVMNWNSDATAGGDETVTGGGAGGAAGTDNTNTNTGTGSANANFGTAMGMGAASTPELDRATRREAQRARRTAESGSQMMHSIAPRTNVDRTDQMPDDDTPLLAPGRR